MSLKEQITPRTATCSNLQGLDNADIQSNDGGSLFTLRRSDDYGYFRDLAKRDRFSQITDQMLEAAIGTIRYFWIGEVQGRRAGLVYLCFMPGWDVWTLDAYRDDNESLYNRGDYSYRTGKLIMDWFKESIGEDLYAMPHKQNRPAIFLAKRLGFKFDSFINEFIILKKEF